MICDSVLLFSKKVKDSRGFIKSGILPANNALAGRKNKYGPFTLLTPTAQLHKVVYIFHGVVFTISLSLHESLQREHSKTQIRRITFGKRHDQKQNWNSYIASARSEITEKGAHGWQEL